MNNQLNELSSTEKRQWFLQQMEAKDLSIQQNIAGQDLRGIDLSELDFKTLQVGSSLSFRGCQLQGANFSSSQLQNVNFEGANLEGANFSNVTAIHCNFNHTDISPNASNLKNINCQNSTLIDVKFQGCNLEKANFESAYINGTFAGSKLDRANFHKACFAGVCFDQANIPQANFSNATFISPKSDYQHHPNRTSFADACLNDSDLKQTIFETHVSFATSELQRTNFRGVDFSSVLRLPNDYISFYAANLKDALMPENWLECIPKHKIHLATLPDGKFYKYEKSDWHKVPFLRHLPLPLQKLLSILSLLVLFSLSLSLLGGSLYLTYQGRIWSFVFAPVLMTILSIIGYTGFQSQPKTATNSWDFSFLILGFPIILLLLEAPFILMGLSINNIPLLASIFYGVILEVPILFIFFSLLKKSILESINHFK